MCSSTYMAFSQNTSHPVGRSPLWLFARTFLNFCHFEGVRMALGQTWFAHMQEPFTRIPNLVLTQKPHLAPSSLFPRTRQTSPQGNTFLCSSFQQLPCLRLRPLKGLLRWHSVLQGPSTPIVCFFRNYWETRTLSGVQQSLCTEVQGHYLENHCKT